MTVETKLTALVDQNKDCAAAYSEEDFWKKLSILPRSVIHQGLEKILLLREVLLSSDAPLWARAAILTGFGYLIIPTDLVPDFLPGVGYLDDLAMLGLILQSTDMLITEEMKAKVKKRIGDPDRLKQKTSEGGDDETVPESG